MKNPLGFIFAAVLLIAGCGGSEQPSPGTTPGQPGANSQGVSSQATPQTPTPLPPPAGPLSPTETFRRYNDAKVIKDAAEVKRLLSKGSLALSEKTAAQRDETLDQVVLSGQTFDKVPPTRNEKITGSTATIEIQNPITGGWEEWYFVKEDGVWKNALDVLIDKISKRLAEEMKKAPAADSHPDTKGRK
jgi:hypothetical protein